MTTSPARSNCAGSRFAAGNDSRIQSSAFSSRLTIAVDFDGHGIGKLLVPLIVRRQAHKEMPANVEALKRRVEAQQPQHPA